MGRMLVAMCRFDLRIPGCNSLKEKRHVLKTLTASLRTKFNVAVAEVDHQDLWQRAAIGVASVAGEGYHLRRVMHQVERHIDTFPAIEVIDSELTLHGLDD
jgi:uncharacterized protein YlxP (DUF503 family)